MGADATKADRESADTDSSSASMQSEASAGKLRPPSEGAMWLQGFERAAPQATGVVPVCMVHAGIES